MPIGRRLWLVATLLLCAVVAVQVGRTIAAALAEVPSFRVANPAWLLPACAVVGLAFGAAAAGFTRLVRAAGERITFVEALWATSAANMGKYLPGKVWAAAGKAMLSRRAGVSLEGALVATALDLYLIVATSVAVGGALWAAGVTDPGLGLTALAFLALVTAAVHPANFRLLSRILTWLLPAAGRALAARGAYHYRHVLEAGAYYILFWLLLGLGFLFLAWAVAATGSGAALMGGFVLSYLAGIFAFFAPGGIGVREGVLHHLLAPEIGAGPSALLAVAGRIWATLTEVAVVLAAWWLSMRRRPADT